jgi:lipopolysaccharide export system protein LptA
MMIPFMMSFMMFWPSRLASLALTSLAIAMLALAHPAAAQAQGTGQKPPLTGEAAVRQQQKQAIKSQQTASPLGIGSANSKEPIKIDADRLDVFDKESRAVFTGNVVAVQGETTVRCTMMTIFYEPRGQPKGAETAAKGAAATPPATPVAQTTRGGNAPPSQNDSAIRKIDCTGPVTVLSKTQTATGDNAIFDRVANKVIMTGNVALADGPNITRGDKLIYDTVTGVANVEVTAGGRVKGLFIPGNAPGATPAGTPGAAAPAAGGAQPASRPRPAPSAQPTN